MAGKHGEPWALVKMKQQNDQYAKLARDEELSLRSASVTQWHAAQDARPGANAKAETAAQLLCVAPYAPLPSLASPSFCVSGLCAPTHRCHCFAPCPLQDGGRPQDGL